MTVESFAGEGDAEGTTAEDVVVWNPWVGVGRGMGGACARRRRTRGAQIDKSKRMGDFGDDEYTHMVCIEPGHVSSFRRLEPRGKWSLKQRVTPKL